MGSLSVRQPAVAGLFYDSDPPLLMQQVDEMLAPPPATASAMQQPRALIVPHAGYAYSGRTAACAYRQLHPWRDSIRRVVLLGPAHRVYLEALALPACQRFATPLGEVEIDPQLTETALQLPAVCVSDEAHRQEHSLEVQLPFLQRALDQFTLLPLVVGHCPATEVAAVVDKLCTATDTLLVVSSDLSHFHNYQQAQALDRRTCERLLQHDQALEGKDACGANALNGLMASRYGQQMTVQLLELCNSGDSAGDHSRVVGYGAFALH